MADVKFSGLTAKTILNDEDLSAWSNWDGAAFDINQKVTYLELKTDLSANLFTGTDTQTLRFNGTTLEASSSLTNGGDNLISINSDQSGTSGAVSLALTNTNASGTVWSLKNVSTAHALLPPKAFTLFESLTSEHRLIITDTGLVMIGAHDRLTQSNIPTAGLDIVGKTDDNTTDSLVIRNFSRTEYFSFRNDGRGVYTPTGGSFTAGHVLTDAAGDGVMTWEAPSGGGGDVTKVGTPIDNQVGVWTGDGTIEGTTGLTYNGTDLGVTGNITLTGTVDGIDVATDVAANTAKTTNATHTGDVTGATALTIGAKKVTLGMLADGTDGELFTWDASGVAAKVAVGTATHVLTSNGVGVAPTFQAAAGGGSLWSDDGGGDISHSGGQVKVIGAGTGTATSFLTQDSSTADTFKIQDNGDVTFKGGGAFYGASAGVFAINDVTPIAGFLLQAKAGGSTGKGSGPLIIVNSAGSSTVMAVYDNSDTFVKKLGVNQSSVLSAELEVKAVGTTGANVLLVRNSVANVLFRVKDDGTVNCDSSFAVGAESLTDSAVTIGDSRTIDAWGLNGISLNVISNTYTDDSTAISGTAAIGVFTSFRTPTLAATNATVTTTDVATVYIQGAPSAGTNQTITNPIALWVDAGNVRVDDTISFEGAPQANSTLDMDGSTNGVIALKKYTVAGVPTAIQGGFIYITDETGGEVPAFSDGTNWRRVTDRIIIA